MRLGDQVGHYLGVGVVIVSGRRVTGIGYRVGAGQHVHGRVLRRPGALLAADTHGINGYVMKLHALQVTEERHQVTDFCVDAAMTLRFAGCRGRPTRLGHAQSITLNL
jgi:hypothetical protein